MLFLMSDKSLPAKSTATGYFLLLPVLAKKVEMRWKGGKVEGGEGVEGVERLKVTGLLPSE